VLRPTRPAGRVLIRRPAMIPDAAGNIVSPPTYAFLFGVSSERLLAIVFRGRGTIDFV